MPYSNQYVEPEHFCSVELPGGGDLHFYHVYREDCIDEGERWNLLTTSTECGYYTCGCGLPTPGTPIVEWCWERCCKHVLVVTELPTWVGPKDMHNWSTDREEKIMSALEEAVKRGILNEHGIRNRAEEEREPD